MKLYKEFQQSKQVGEDFLQWLLVRKLTFLQQMILIFVLIALWLIAAPHLTFWVLFFKAAVFIALISALISFIHQKRKKRD